MHSALKFLKANALPLSALVVSVLAMISTAYQVETTKYHNRLSVIPVVMFKYSHAEQLSLSFENAGLGPAVIKGLDAVFFDNEINFKDEFKLAMLYDLLRQKEPDFGPGGKYDLANAKSGISFSVLSKNSILKAGESVVLISAENSAENKSAAQAIETIFNNVKLRVCYRSLYGDFFVASTGRLENLKNSCVDDYTYKIFEKNIMFKWPWITPIGNRDILGD